jgi:hypothetical protein
MVVEKPGQLRTKLGNGLGAARQSVEVPNGGIGPRQIWAEAVSDSCDVSASGVEALLEQHEEPELVTPRHIDPNSLGVLKCEVIIVTQREIAVFEDAVDSMTQALN